MKNELVYKATKLVVEKYSLTANQAKLVALLTSKIKKDDKTFNEVTFKGSELLETLGLGKDNYKDLKKLTGSLVSKVLQIQEPKAFIQVAFCSSAKYYIKDGIAYIDLRFDDYMRPYYLQLQQNLQTYIWYRLEYIMQFTSQYSFRIYELIKKNSYNGKTREPFFIMSIKELRNILLLEKKYKQFNRFKMKILEVATLEITALSDMICTYEPSKIDSRRYTHIRFHFQTKDEEIQKIKNYKLGKKGIEKFIKGLDKTKKREKNIKEYKEDLEQMRKEKDLELENIKLKWTVEYYKLYPTEKNQKFVTLEKFIKSKMRGK